MVEEEVGISRCPRLCNALLFPRSVHFHSMVGFFCARKGDLIPFPLKAILISPSPPERLAVRMGTWIGHMANLMHEYPKATSDQVARKKRRNSCF